MTQPVDVNQLLQALHAADAAGDTDGAKHIASLIYNAQIPPNPVIPPPPSQTSPQNAMNDPATNPAMQGGELQIGPFHTGIHTSPKVDQLLSGTGQSFMDTVHGIQQLTGNRTAAQTDADRELQAPLDRTGAGIAGNILGGVAQMAIPGMGADALGAKIATNLATNPGALQAARAIYRIAAPAGSGALYGATAPVGSDESRLGNTAMGAAAGEAGHILGNATNTVLRAGEDSLTRGARIGAQIARKYNIPLSFPQVSASPFLRYMSSALDKLPFSGADARAENQKVAFNNALGKISGVSTPHGIINTDATDQAFDEVGGAIGDIADKHTAYPTNQNLNQILNVVRSARDNATPEVAASVESKARQLLAHLDPDTVTIPGGAWRQANTALGRQMRSETNGDLKHYLGQLQEPYMDMIQQGMSPGTQDAFRQLRGQYRNLKTIEPLAEKAGNTGINPALLRGRAIASKNNRGPMQELANLGQEEIKPSTNDSGTAQRALMYGLIGSVAAGGGALATGQPRNTAEEFGAGPLGLVLAGGLGSRLIHSPLVYKYMASRLPEALASGVRGVTHQMPAAAAAYARTPSPPDLAPDEPHMADGGSVRAQDSPYRKSSFWDLVKQAVKEATGDQNSPPAKPADAPVGDGMAKQASEDLVSYPQRLDDAINAQSQ